MEYPLLSLELAREIELAEAEAAVACAERLMAAQGDGAGAVAPVAGGYAVYCGANSPVTQAVGLGLNGAVSSEEFDRLEEFYFGRREPVRVETCPMADGSLIEHYRERSYYVSEFSNVMVRPVEKSADALPAGIEIQKAADGEIDLWTLTVAQGFAEHLPVTQEILSVMRLFADGKNTECYFARVDGKMAGGATHCRAFRREYVAAIPEPGRADGAAARADATRGGAGVRTGDEPGAAGKRFAAEHYATGIPDAVYAGEV